ncbi:MAG: regulatory protein RecX [Gemmatimonadetes bacterium]|nr:regulatory protein RecX [Gemmatimonadota bacterium]
MPRKPTEPITDPKLAREKALKMLERRPYPRAELERALKRKGVVADVAADLVERLADSGLVNDATFARTLARSHLVGRGSSVRRVQMELARKGVARDVATDALAEVREDEGLQTEDASVERAARKKLKSLGGLDPLTRARRLTGFLARRGFSGDLIRTTLRRLDQEAAEKGDDG